MSNVATKKKRPVYLNLVQIRLPLPGFVSILHRASGALLFVSAVWLLFMLDRSLSSEAGFESVRHYVGFPVVKLALLGLIWAYCHHFCAGIRYLFLDLDKGVDLPTARMSAWAVLAASLALTAFLGAKLW
ncbi:MAG: succinate dehydrogenase, cytochrome b556 subunit [Proteobacteria bacterium]|nr:succinate dehydrogenase, cytochrome b556 subunit [Pseudomonadota bacterium]